MSSVLSKLGVLAVGASCAIACSSASGNRTLDGGLAESSAGDGAVRDVKTALPNEAADDSGPPGCFKVMGSGASETCTFQTAAAGDTTCASAPGMKVGHCPQVCTTNCGCCLIYPNLFGDGGMNDFTATCYYSASAAMPALEACDTRQYEQMDAQWDQTVP